MLEPKGNCSPVRKELRWFFYVLITRTFLKTVYNTSETAAQSAARNKPDGGRYSAILKGVVVMAIPLPFWVIQMGQNGITPHPQLSAYESFVIRNMCGLNVWA